MYRVCRCTSDNNVTPTVQSKAEEWLRMDMDPDSRAVISNMLQQGSPQLHDLICTRLEFGMYDSTTLRLET